MQKEGLLDVIMYVFENYIENELKAQQDVKAIASDMLKIGFKKNEVDRALGWLHDLGELNKGASLMSEGFSSKAVRIYSEYEMNKISIEARSYLLYLEREGYVDPVGREFIIDRLMALDDPVIDVTEVKWVALMVLFSQTDKKEELALMEELVLFHNNDEVAQ